MWMFWSLVLLATGCDQIPSPLQGGREAGGGGDTCNAAAHAELVGQSVDALTETGFDQPVRIVPQGGIVTMDFLPARLNVEIDSGETIVRLYCG